MLGKVLLSMDELNEKVTLNGYRYFDDVWVDWVETIDLKSLTYLEWDINSTTKEFV